MSYLMNSGDILQTIQMIDQQHLDVRTITMGISLLDCCGTDMDAVCEKIYDKICFRAKDLVKTGEDIEREFGIPIVNKRISVTPIAIVAGSCGAESYVPVARALDRAAKAVGVNFIGGFSALVQKGSTLGDERLIASIPEALAETERVCASVNVGSTRAGINMDAVREMGRVIKRPPSSQRTRTVSAAPSLWCSAMPWRTIPSWRERSTAWANRSALSTSAFPAQALSVTRCRTVRVPLSTWWPKPSKDRLQGDPHGPARGTGGFRETGHPLRHRGPLARPHAGDRRFRGPHSGGHGS